MRWNLTPSERFWAKVYSTIPPAHRPELGPCWEWTANHIQGYGLFRGPKRYWRAHRISYEWEYGPFPETLWVLHRCDNHPCVRPSHLFLGTAQDNYDDMVAKGRRRIVSVRKTFCKRGHNITANAYVWKKYGHRRCRICRTINSQTAHLRTKAAAKQARLALSPQES